MNSRVWRRLLRDPREMHETGSHADYGDGSEGSHQSKAESFTSDQSQDRHENHDSRRRPRVVLLAEVEMFEELHVSAIAYKLLMM